MLRTVGFLIVVQTLWAAPVKDSGGVWLDVPFLIQTENGCGAASAGMIIRYWNGPSPASDPAVIMKEIYSPPASGIYASQLQNYLEKQGFRTFKFRGEWADLVHHLSKGRPLLICLSERRPDLHYVVVAGIDWQSDLVFLNDPARQKLFAVSREKFLKAWKASDYWTLLAVPEEPK